jgi:hypothetical protein
MKPNYATPITPEQRAQTLALLAEGLPQKQVAKRMGISESAVCRIKVGVGGSRALEIGDPVERHGTHGVVVSLTPFVVRTRKGRVESRADQWSFAPTPSMIARQVEVFRLRHQQRGELAVIGAPGIRQTSPQTHHLDHRCGRVE